MANDLLHAFGTVPPKDQNAFLELVDVLSVAAKVRLGEKARDFAKSKVELDALVGVTGPELQSALFTNFGLEKIDPSDTKTPSQPIKRKAKDGTTWWVQPLGGGRFKKIRKARGK